MITTARIDTTTRTLRRLRRSARRTGRRHDFRAGAGFPRLVPC